MIREATIDDLSEIVRMGELFSKEAGIEPDRSTIVKTAIGVIESDTGALLVGDGSMVVALAYPLFMNESVIVVQELAWWVDPDKRSGGAGKELLDGLESWATKIGAHRLMMIALDTSPKHVDKFYKMSGFVPLEKTYVKEL